MPIVEIFQKHLSVFIKVFLINLPFSVGFYLIFIYNPLWMQQFLDESKEYTLKINSLSLFVMVLFIPLSAQLSNKVGRKPLLLFANAGFILLSWPLYSLMVSDVPFHTLIGQSVFAMLMGLFIGSIAVVMVELFSQNIRVSAVSIAYNVSFALFGGTAPMVATWLIHTTQDKLSLAWYLSLSALISFFTVLTIEETYQKKHLD